MQQRLRQLRKSAGITQQWLGDQVGVSRQTIISIENGKYTPSLELAMGLAAHFGLYVEEMFSVNGRYAQLGGYPRRPGPGADPGGPDATAGEMPAGLPAPGTAEEV